MIVSWMTTNRCNLKCVHCYQDADECDNRELSTEEARAMISDIARAGFKIMIFSGGEPLMRALFVCQMLVILDNSPLGGLKLEVYAAFLKITHIG